MNIQAELTEREEEIAEVMGLGAISQKEAANILGISIKTVDNTLQKIKEKAGISKAAGLHSAVPEFHDPEAPGKNCLRRKFPDSGGPPS